MQSDLPPPLAWIPSLMHSLEGAMGHHPIYSVTPTINPLVYKLRIYFTGTVSGSTAMQVWNLFQMFAAKNDCVAQGKRGEGEDRVLFAEVVMKQRLGLPKSEHPAG